MDTKKLLAATRYRLRDSGKTIAVLYLCVIVITVVMVGILPPLIARFPEIVPDNGTMVSSSDIASVITLFVLSMNFFKESLQYFSVCGVSRKTHYLSAVLALGALSLFCTVVDQIVSLLATPFSFYRSSYLQMNLLHVSEFGGYTFGLVVEELFWHLCLCLAACALGLFLTTAYYRMNKALKICVSIGVPAVFLYVIPFVDLALGGTLLRAFVRAALAIHLDQPLVIAVLALVTGIVLFALTWLLTRRAVVRE